jgi:hypothetical protein
MRGFFFFKKKKHNECKTTPKEKEEDKKYSLNPILLTFPSLTSHKNAIPFSFTVQHYVQNIHFTIPTFNKILSTLFRIQNVETTVWRQQETE